MENVLIIIILIAILSLAVGYIVRTKKKGIKCIGCPYCSSCQKQK